MVVSIEWYHQTLLVITVNCQQLSKTRSCNCNRIKWQVTITTTNMDVIKAILVNWLGSSHYQIDRGNAGNTTYTATSHSYLHFTLYFRMKIILYSVWECATKLVIALFFGYGLVEFGCLKHSTKCHIQQAPITIAIIIHLPPPFRKHFPNFL